MGWYQEDGEDDAMIDAAMAFALLLEISDTVPQNHIPG